LSAGFLKVSPSCLSVTHLSSSESSPKIVGGPGDFSDTVQVWRGLRRLLKALRRSVALRPRPGRISSPLKPACVFVGQRSPNTDACPFGSGRCSRLADSPHASSYHVNNHISSKWEVVLRQWLGALCGNLFVITVIAQG
jgi:hypothetical protein